MEVFLLLNGYEFVAPVDEQERIMLSSAGGDLSREAFSAWVREHAVAPSGERRS